METAIAPFVENKLGRTVTNSRAVAEFFGKQHKDVLRAIDNLECSREFYGRNFALVTFDFVNGRGGTQKGRSFDLTKDGFVFLAMGFTGPKAARFKEAYIARFNEMQEELRNSHRTAYLGQVECREFFLNGQRLRAFASERGAFVLTADVVPMAYEKARSGALPSGSYTKDLPASSKVLLSPRDTPTFFEGQPNSQYQALSEEAALKLLDANAAGAGRGGKAQAARKLLVRSWLQSEVFPALHAITPKPHTVNVPPKTALEMREQAEKLIAAAEALDALEEAKTRAAEALGNLI